MDNAQSPELRSYLAGQIARAACIFNVDEIVVFDDYGSQGPSESKICSTDNDESGNKKHRQCCTQLARILQYLECPQYLRKFFFPIHRDLKFSGLLNPLDAPHHLRQYSEFIFREGVVSNKPQREHKGSYVNIGLLNDCMIDIPLNPGLRVTVKLNSDQDLKSRKLKGTVVAPSMPRQETGIYWGYNVRIADNLSSVFTESPYENGYDLTIGTSDKGESVNDIEKSSLSYQHAIIVFGGLQGIDGALENDDKLEVDDPSLLFDHYLNVVPGQGSRTIRTEEAVLIALANLDEKLEAKEKVKIFNLSETIPQSEDTGIKQFEHVKMKKRKIEDLDRFD